jgi:hypothetical protein
VSAGTVRLLRKRVSDTRQLALSMDRDSLRELVGGCAQREEDPDLYLHGMLVHEGLRVETSADDPSVVELKLRPGYAVAGALWTTAAAFPVAAVGLWAYGAMVVVTGGAIAWALRRWWEKIARSAPGFLPRGRLLGAAAAAAAIIVLGAAVIYPIREIRRPDHLAVVLSAVIE